MNAKYLSWTQMVATSTKSAKTDTLGGRIRQERLALGLSQEAFAKKLGVHRRTQGNYESGEREPDAAYLEAASRAGADVGYMLTGERASGWHQSLIHMLGVILDALLLTAHEQEFGAAWQLAYDEYAAFTRDEGVPERADHAVRELVRKSPLLLDADAMADVIERLDFVLETKSIVLTRRAKVDVILRLYREAKIQGKPVDLETVTAYAEERRY